MGWGGSDGLRGKWQRDEKENRRDWRCRREGGHTLALQQFLRNWPGLTSHLPIHSMHHGWLLLPNDIFLSPCSLQSLQDGPHTFNPDIQVLHIGSNWSFWLFPYFPYKNHWAQAFCPFISHPRIGSLPHQGAHYNSRHGEGSILLQTPHILLAYVSHLMTNHILCNLIYFLFIYSYTAT